MRRFVRVPVLTASVVAWLVACGVIASCSSEDSTAEGTGPGGRAGAGGPGGGAGADAAGDAETSLDGDGGGDAPLEGSSDAPKADAPDSSPCTSGQLVCTGTLAHKCGEPPANGADCSKSSRVCVPGLGCVACVPGSGTCTPALATWCKSDGSGFVEFACDADLGLSCNGNLCEGLCAASATEARYIGCEYFPVSVINDVNNSYDFEVAVANASASQPALVKVTGGALAQPLSVTVAAGGVERVKLPWVEAVKVCNESSLGNGFDQINACSAAHNPDYSSRVVTKGAYRLASDRPVAVYQFAPIQASKSGFQAGTTEASLLLPQTALGKRYRVATYGQGFARGAVAVVATIDGTTVTVHPTADVTAGGGNPAGIKAGQSGTYTANRGDVIEVVSATAGASTNEGDLTGTLVEANHPVEVLGAHGCAWVVNAQSCDHLEDSMFPLGTLGNDYLVKSMAYAGSIAYLLRVVATEDDTTVELDPALVPKTTLAKAGTALDFGAADMAVRVKASKRVLVAGLNEGDNTLAPVVPVQRYLSDYLFYAPQFQNNYVKLYAPSGAAIALDGATVPAGSFSPIGTSGFSWAIVPVVSGPHRASSNVKFGLAVFGNQAANYVPSGLPSAYEYPGGLDLTETAGTTP